MFGKVQVRGEKYMVLPVGWRYNVVENKKWEKNMGYLFLIITLILFSVKGYCGKKTSTDIVLPTDPLLFNFLRMVFCVAIGFFMILLDRALGQVAVAPSLLLLTFFAGAANAAFLIGWILAVRRIPLVTMDVLLTIGSLLPAVLCLILFDEAVSVPKMIGFGLILLATVVLSGYGGSTGKRAGVLGVVLAVTATLGEGLSSFCQQLYKQYFTVGGTRFCGVAYENSVYQFYTYVFSAAVLALAFTVIAVVRYHRRGAEADTGAANEAKGEKTHYVRRIFASCIRPLPYIVVMAICMFGGNYLQTAATVNYGMSPQVLYPVLKGGCLVTVNLTAMLFFNEKPTRRSIVGSGIALCGSVLMSVLQ